MIDKRIKNSIIKRAKITDIVSDYLHLTQRDTDFAGYCPFCASRMKDFLVNTSSNTFRCNNCGKSGASIDFVMEMLNLNFDEAIQHIGNKYGIDFDNSSESSKAKRLYDINSKACQYYQDQLANSETGRNVALTYYKDARGFSDEIISGFQLGYSPDRNENTLIAHLEGQGYSTTDIIDSGIGVQYDDKPAYDRFHERITFPITNLAGKILAFSCRTLKKDSDIAKYKNTNDTPIYTKGNEIYGLYQARNSIIEQNRCILVEGNADVVSMHQAGFTNTIAPLGTGFTSSQAAIIRRFTDNVTLLFDGDSAGLHANEVALQHFLPLGIVPDIVLLPEGEDPDSFARQQSFEEASNFLNNNKLSLVQFFFKTKLGSSLSNPIKTAQVTKEIIKNIALIPDKITRAHLAKECKDTFHIDEASVLADITNAIAILRDEEFKKKQQEAYRKQYLQQNSGNSPEQMPEIPNFDDLPEAESSLNTDADILNSSIVLSSPASNTLSKTLLSKERELMHYVAKYGMVQFSKIIIDENNTKDICLIEYIDQEIQANGLTINDITFNKIFAVGRSLVEEFYKDLDTFTQNVEESKKEAFNIGIEELKLSNLDFDSIRIEEEKLIARIENKAYEDIDNFRRAYFEEYLCNYPDKQIRQMCLDLINEPFKLSKIHTQFTAVKTEYDNLDLLVQDAINNLRYEVINNAITALQNKLKHATDTQEVLSVMTEISDLQGQRKKLAAILGERVLNPN